MMSKRLVAGALILVSLACGAPCTDASAANISDTGALPSVTVIAVHRGTLVEQATLIGTFVAREEAMVTPQIDGLAIAAILVEEGDTVGAGQVLARLSRDALDASLAENAANAARAEASIAQAEGQIDEARANRTEAVTALGRATALVSRGDLSRETFDQRQNASDVADARLRAASEQLAVAHADLALAVAQRAELEVRLARTDLRAPVAGLVTRRSARLGAVVGTGSDPLFRIAQDGAIEMEATVPETELARLRAGQAATLFAPGRSAPGHVRLVAPEVNATTRLGRVRIALDDRSRPPAIGSFARASVVIAARAGVIVPLSAVLFQPDGPVVEIAAAAQGHPAEAARRIVTRHVTIGLSDDQHAELDSGIEDGDRVVAVSGAFLRDGDHVLAVSVAALPVPAGAD